MKMTWKQKLGYFWDYHKWKVIIPVIALLVIVIFIRSYQEETKPLTLYIAIVNGIDTSEAERSFAEDYPRDCGIDTEKAPVKTEGGFLYPKSTDESAAMDTITDAGIQRYQGILINGDLDVTISTEWAVDAYAESGAYVDLTELMPDEWQDKYKERFYYAKDDEGRRVPVGIYIKTDSLGDFYDDGSAILTVSTYSGRKEEALGFMEWILQKEQRER